MVCRSKGEQLMILSHKQIEEIAAAVIGDFNKFFFGDKLDDSRRFVQCTPIDQFAKDFLCLLYTSPSPRDTR